MPRQSRIDTTGALHHIIARGIERCKIFEHNQDRYDFLKNLGLILKQTQTACFAWSLMSNHFHLLLRTGVAPIATVHAKAAFRPCSPVQPAPSKTRSPVPEPLQIDFMSGRPLPFGVGWIYSLEPSESTTGGGYGAIGPVPLFRPWSHPRQTRTRLAER